MSFALVNIIEVPLITGQWEGEGLATKYVTQEITAIIGTICNLIAYDGVAAYTPPSGYKLEQVPDTAKVGDTGY